MYAIIMYATSLLLPRLALGTSMSAEFKSWSSTLFRLSQGPAKRDSDSYRFQEACMQLLKAITGLKTRATLMLGG
jgi:hypothetical protein